LKNDYLATSKREKRDKLSLDCLTQRGKVRRFFIGHETLSSA